MPEIHLEGNHTADLISWFEHGDYDLARRRLLDVVYDLADTQLLHQSIQWSRQYHHEGPVSAGWVDAGMEICRQIPAQAGSENAGKLLIESEEISKSYGSGFFSLSAIPLKLFAGEIIGVVGENGNGKTTLLRSVAGYLETALISENYHYPGQEKPFHYALKSATGFIPQRIPRWYGKLIDNLRFSAAIAGIKGDLNELMTGFVLERFGLGKFANLNWNQISSGYRTRFEIARLILQRPAVLILDEPLANLDIVAQQTLLQDLKFIARSARHPMGIILTSQQLFEVEKVADRVLFIRSGKGVYNDEGLMSKFRVFELETSTDRERISEILGNKAEEIRYNGGLFEIHTAAEPAECMKLLLDGSVSVRYFRDISASTKRYF